MEQQVCLLEKTVLPKHLHSLQPMTVQLAAGLQKNRMISFLKHLLYLLHYSSHFVMVKTHIKKLLFIVQITQLDLRELLSFKEKN
jgi:hypothetical protein